jgi:hypothetical protein
MKREKQKGEILKTPYYQKSISMAAIFDILSHLEFIKNLPQNMSGS